MHNSEQGPEHLLYLPEGFFYTKFPDTSYSEHER